MARPIWKGHISFGLVNIPVTLFGAEQRFDLHFNLLDRRNHARVKYERVNEATGEPVPWDEIVKAYNTEDDQYVELTDEDFEKAAVESTQSVDIEDFVDREAIDVMFYDKPYYLVPGKKGEKGYVLLREALRRSGKAGIAKVVLRTKQYLAAVVPEGDALVLELLRFDQELRKPQEFELPGENLDEFKVNDRELELAERLIEAMTGEWQPEKYKDDYHDKLMAWIQEKARHGDQAKPPTAHPVETTEVIDMMELLKASVEGSKGGARSESEARGRAKGAGKARTEVDEEATTPAKAKREAKTAARKPAREKAAGKRPAARAKQEPEEKKPRTRAVG